MNGAEMHPNTFTERENDVVHLLLQGFENKQMAKTLGISERTVEFHLSNIFAKLGVNSRTEAVIELTEQANSAPTVVPAETNLWQSPVVKAPQRKENRRKLHSIERPPMKSNKWYIFAAGFIFVAGFLVILLWNFPLFQTIFHPDQVEVLATPKTDSHPTSMNSIPASSPTPFITATTSHLYTQDISSQPVTLNLEWFYIDSARLYLQFSISGFPIPSDTKILYLVDSQNIRFYNPDGTPLPIQLDQFTRGGSGGEPEDDTLPQVFETTFNATFSNAAQTILPGASYQIVIPVGGQVYDGNSKLVELPETTFTLSTGSFYPGSLTFITNQIASIQDKTLRFTKMEVNPDETNAFICITDPGGEQWLPTASILYKGKTYNLRGSNLTSPDQDTQKGPVCYRMTFDVPVDLNENPKSRLALWVQALTKDRPEIFSPGMVERAINQVAQQGIGFKYVIVSHGSEIQITQKPAGMTDMQAQEIIDKALTQEAATDGILIFNLN
jgi:DNA-binding CsgD family transcriptional regulator